MLDLLPIHLETLNLIRAKGSLSRAQISAMTGIGLTKTTEIIRELIQKSLVEEIEGQSSGGRKPALLQIKGDIYYTLGIDIGTRVLRAAVINTRGETLAAVQTTEYWDLNKNLTVKDLKGFIEKALAVSGLSWRQINGIGVGITGIVDENKGTCLFFPAAPHLNGSPLAELVKEETGLERICLTDSVRGMALAELRYGLGKMIPNFILINIGVGLGAGIVVNGKILTGSRGIIGEFGHIYVGKSDEICCCGNYGCLESMASGWALVRKAVKAIKSGVITSIKSSSPDEPVQLADLIDSARAGDKFALNLLEESANYLSIGMSTLVNLLNPERIIIGGGLAEGLQDILIESLIRRTKAKSLPWVQNDIDIRLSQLGEYSAARGIATLIMDNLFDFQP